MTAHSRAPLTAPQREGVLHVAARVVQLLSLTPAAELWRWLTRSSSHSEAPMNNDRVFKMSFAGVYPHYIAKAEKKGRTKKEVDEVICWLTGYSPRALSAQINERKDLETFFSEAPSLHPNASKITGTICGVRIQEIENPLMRKIRYMDKLVDELAQGRPMEKILRA
jgi:hypothetical protein